MMLSSFWIHCGYWFTYQRVKFYVFGRNLRIKKVIQDSYSE